MFYEDKTNDLLVVIFGAKFTWHVISGYVVSAQQFKQLPTTTSKDEVIEQFSIEAFGNAFALVLLGAY